MERPFEALYSLKEKLSICVIAKMNAAVRSGISCCMSQSTFIVRCFFINDSLQS